MEKTNNTFPHNPLRFDSEGMSRSEVLQLYSRLLLPRMIEEKMLSQLRQGKISKWFSGIGQEAISVGVAAAMPNDTMDFTDASEPWHLHNPRDHLGPTVRSI